MLISAKQEHGEVVGVPHRCGLVLVFFTGAEHLAHRGAGGVVDGLYGPHRGDGDRRGPVAIHDAPRRRDHGDGLDDPLVPGDVVAQQGKQRREQAAQRGPAGAVDRVAALLAGAGEVEDQAVIPLGHGQRHAGDFILHAEVLPGLPLSVWQLSQPGPQLFLGLADQGPAGFIHGVKAVFLDQGQQPLPRHIVAGDHGIEIQRHHVRRPHHVQEGVHDRPVDLAFFNQAQPWRTEAFRVDVLGVGAKAAGVGRADVVHMDETGAPRRQLALMMHGRHQVHIGGVQGGRVGIVQEKHIAFVDVIAKPPDDGLAGLRGAG